MPRVLDTIEGEPITFNDDGSITFTAKMAVDGDGSGPSHGDPDYQSDTSLHQDGKPLNADEDCYIVLPPQIIAAVGPIVLGCQGHVENTLNGMETDVVVGDIGPHHKIGEASIATCRSIGVNPSPTTGGEEQHRFKYTVWPGRAAVVNGKQYTLQPHHS